MERTRVSYPSTTSQSAISTMGAVNEPPPMAVKILSLVPYLMPYEVPNDVLGSWKRAETDLVCC